MSAKHSGWNVSLALFLAALMAFSSVEICRAAPGAYRDRSDETDGVDPTAIIVVGAVVVAAVVVWVIVKKHGQSGTEDEGAKSERLDLRFEPGPWYGRVDLGDQTSALDWGRIAPQGGPGTTRAIGGRLEWAVREERGH